MEPFILLLGFGLFVIFVGLTFYVLKRVSHESALLETVTKPSRRTVSMDEEETGEKAKGLTAVLELLTKPLTFVRTALKAKADDNTVKRLARAGYRRPVHADLYLASRLICPVVAGLLVAYVVPENTLFFFLIAVVLGFFIPDFWLTESINRRRQRIERSLPDGLDLLSICMEAGLGLDQAIVRVGQELRNTHPDFSTEVLQINFEQRAGIPRIDSWRAFAERTNSESLRSFVAMLIQTERFGTPVAVALSAFSDSLRVQRKQKAEEKANKAAIKLLFPLILFIFPLVFLVTVGPALISLLHSLQDLSR